MYSHHSGEDMSNHLLDSLESANDVDNDDEETEEAHERLPKQQLPKRQLGGDIGDEVDRPSFPDGVEDRASLDHDPLFELVEHARRETRADELAKASVAGIVHRDHRTEELVELRGCLDGGDA